MRPRQTGIRDKLRLVSQAVKELLGANEFARRHIADLASQLSLHRADETPNVVAILRVDSAVVDGLASEQPPELRA